ncbi:MAG: extracellular solute-binding protein [Clostridia bacterium]|nr:extracellular solute-binding protein [Clostridia bacterium]
MKKFKKLAAFAVASTMLVSCLAGCGEKQKKFELTDVSEGGTLIATEPAEVTFFYKQSEAADGQWRMLNEAGKLTNVYAIPQVAKSVDFEQEFGLMIGDPKNMPDIVETYDPTTLSQYGAQGAFVKLNEYFDEYAPNIKAFLDENPDIKKRITAYDGNIYYIPFIPGGHVSTAWFVRQDWLDKLNLSEPTTRDELYNVLKAFKEKDPNGNGQADEIPFFSSSKIKCLFPLWDANPDWYVENGKVKYGPYEPEYKDAVKGIAQWYKEGLIDREIYTRTDNPREKMFADNIGGVTHDWVGSTAGFNTNENVLKNAPDFNIAAMAPPASEAGKKGVELESRPISSAYGWAINSNSANIEMIVRYFDFWFTEEGRRLMNFGIEGEHYDMVDGKPVFKAELLAQSDFKQKLAQEGVQMDIGYRQDFEYEKQWLTDDAVAAMELYENGGFIKEQFPILTMEFTPEEMEEYSNLKTQITTRVDEMQQKWILGNSDIESEYDSYISDLDSLGMKRLLEIQQSAYERYNSQK